VLGEVVEDLVPRSLRADEHMSRRLERWLVDECPIRHADMGAVAHSPMKKRPALSAAHRVVPVGVAEHINEPAPSVTVSFSRSISPQGKNAEPVIARQFEQWQLNATTNWSETS
jgi:hypothetical protein